MAGAVMEISEGSEPRRAAEEALIAAFGGELDRFKHSMDLPTHHGAPFSLQGQRHPHGGVRRAAAEPRDASYDVCVQG